MSLKELIGETITQVEVAQWDMFGDESHVSEIYRITTKNGKKIAIQMSAGDKSNVYCTAYSLKMDENGTILPDSNEYCGQGNFLLNLLM